MGKRNGLVLIHVTLVFATLSWAKENETEELFCVSSIDAYLMKKFMVKKSEPSFWSLPMSSYHRKFQLRTLTPYF